MLNNLAIKALNLLLQANPNSQNILKKYATKIVALNLPLLSITLIIAADGSLEAETTEPDCSITIPLASASHFIHQDEVKTFKNLQIEGNRDLAKNILEAFATIEVSKVLYLQQNPVLSMFAVRLEQIIQQLVSYAKLVSHNASLSTSQYLQYETEVIADKYEVEEFCNQVDDVRSRYTLLAKRVERITAQS